MTDENRIKMKSIKETNIKKIELIKEANTKKIKQIKDYNATIISSLSNSLEHQINCLELCEKKVEENQKEIECDIVNIKCHYNT